MYELLIYVTIATSIILFLIFTIYNSRRRRALERELSRLKSERPPDYQKEFEEKQKQFRKEFDDELRRRREENDAEILKRRQDAENFLESYKKSRFQVIESEIEKEKEEAIYNAGETAAELGQRLISLFAQMRMSNLELEELRRTQEAATEALSREALKKEQYNLNLTETDLIEIKELQGVAYKYSRIRPIILKAIYDIYYAPEVKKLVNRVVGSQRVSGIYRITCKTDGRVYIGKSVDIAARWATHFKRAAGVESETTNLLYPAMRENGLENFTFEIIESGVPEDQLGSREKYWQSFYGAKTHGFSVR